MKQFNRTITAIIVLTLFAGIATPFSSAAAEDFLSPQLKAAISIDADSFINASIDYDKNWEKIPGRIQELKAKANPTIAEITATRNQLLNLKRLLNSMKTSLTAVINKLKTANKFIEQDNFVLNSVRGKNAGAASKIQAEGGAHTILESTTDISGQLTRIDQLLADPIFRRGSAALYPDASGASEFKVVRASFRAEAPAAPAFRLNFTCLVLGSRLIIKTVRGNDTQRDVDQFVNTCSGQ
jgi:hypothetical protein